MTSLLRVPCIENGGKWSRNKLAADWEGERGRIDIRLSGGKSGKTGGGSVLPNTHRSQRKNFK